jgi:mannose PTS system EIIA component
MFGLIILAHGRLGEEFLNVLQDMVGSLDYVKAINFHDTNDITLADQTVYIENLIKSVNTGDGVILVTDLFGGTPSNLAISFLSMPNVEVIAGLSLPMLLKLTSCRNLPIKEAVAKAKEAAQQSVHVPSSILRTEPFLGPAIAPVA